MSKIDYTTVVTSEARFSFGKLFEPVKTQGGYERYELTLLFPHPDDLSGDELKAYEDSMQKLQDLAKNAAQLEWGDKIPQHRSPFIDQERFVDPSRPQYKAGAVMLRLNTTKRPGVVDHNLDPIEDPSLVYDGAHGKAAVFAKAYDFKDDNGMRSRGVKFVLQSVQKTRDGDKIGGGTGKHSAADHFAPLDKKKVGDGKGAGGLFD